MEKMKRYVVQFAGVYILCNILVAAITYVLNFEVPSSMGIITLIASTAPVMQSFVKREQRVPTKSERSNFATFATLASLVLSAVVFLTLFAVYQVNPLDLMSVLGIPFYAVAALLAFAVALSWIVIYFFSGFMAKQTLKQIEKANLKKL